MCLPSLQGYKIKEDKTGGTVECTGKTKTAMYFKSE